MFHEIQLFLTNAMYWVVSLVPKQVAKKVWDTVLHFGPSKPYEAKNLNLSEQFGYHSAGVLLKNNENKILVVQERSDGNGSCINLPGGKREVTEFNPLTTAKRELAEETGVTLVSDDINNVTWLSTGKYALFDMNASNYNVLKWTSPKTERIMWLTPDEIRGSGFLKKWPLREILDNC